jgi:hypothetical protein
VAFLQRKDKVKKKIVRSKTRWDSRDDHNPVILQISNGGPEESSVLLKVSSKLWCIGLFCPQPSILSRGIKLFKLYHLGEE